MLCDAGEEVLWSVNLPSMARKECGEKGPVMMQRKWLPSTEVQYLYKGSHLAMRGPRSWAQGRRLSLTSLELCIRA
jgi:hypothetical protein